MDKTLQNKIANRIYIALEGNGQCFRRAYYLQEKIGGLLCQGQVQAGNVPLHCHAWVEKGNNCYDDSLGKLRTMPKEVYYALGNVRDVYRYTQSQTYKWAVDTGHFGPWEGREACPPITKKRRGCIMKLGESALKIAKRLVAEEITLEIIGEKFEAYKTEVIRYRKEKEKLLAEVDRKLEEMGLSDSNDVAFREYKNAYKMFFGRLSSLVVNFFQSRGIKIRISDSDTLMEYFFAGNIFRNSKVSFHLIDGKMSIMLRNENTRNDIKINISLDSNFNDIIRIIDEYFRNGFWN